MARHRRGRVPRPRGLATAHIRNPFVRLGFLVLKGRERRAFLDSTKRRMRRFVDVALEQEARSEAARGPLREVAAELTARPSAGAGGVHDELAGKLGNDPSPT